MPIEEKKGEKSPPRSKRLAFSATPQLPVITFLLFCNIREGIVLKAAEYTFQ